MGEAHGRVSRAGHSPPGGGVVTAPHRSCFNRCLDPPMRRGRADQARDGRNPSPRRSLSGLPAVAGGRAPSAQRARLAGSRRPGSGRAATRRGDLRGAIARHPPLPAFAPGEAKRADFMYDADTSPGNKIKGWTLQLRRVILPIGPRVDCESWSTESPT